MPADQKASKTYAIVGSLEPLSKEALAKERKELMSQTVNIWNPENAHKLGIGRGYHKRALDRFRRLNQYRSPDDETLRTEFENLLFRRWYNVWRARDYSVHGIEARVQEGELDANRVNIICDHAMAFNGVDFPVSHFPPYHPTEFEELVPTQRTVKPRFLSHPHMNVFTEGCVVGTDQFRSYQSYMQSKSSWFQWAFIQQIDSDELSSVTGCWLEDVQGVIKAEKMNESVVRSSIVLSNRQADEDIFSGTRFMSNLSCANANWSIKSKEFDLDFHVGGTFTSPKISGDIEKINSGAQLIDTALHLKETSTPLLEGFRGKLRVNRAAGERRSIFVKLVRIRCEELHLGAGIGTVEIEHCTIKRLKEPSNSWVGSIEFSSIGSINENNADAVALQNVTDFTSVMTSFFVQLKFSDHLNSGQLNKLKIKGCDFLRRFDASSRTLRCVEIGSLANPTIFRDVVDFSAPSNGETVAFDRVDFKNVQLLADCNFNNREFRGRTSFDECVFHQNISFHGAVFHSDTSFRGAEFKWKNALRAQNSLLTIAQRQSSDEEIEESPEIAKLQVDRVHKFFLYPVAIALEYLRLTIQALFLPERFARNRRVAELNEKLGDLERSFRTLRQAMEGLNAADQAAIFHLNEMRARHSRIGDGSVPRAEKWAGMFYDFISDYGGSFVKPFLWFLALIPACGVGYWWLGKQVSDKPIEIIDGFSVSFLVMVRPWYQLSPAFARELEDTEQVDTATELIRLLLADSGGWFLGLSTLHSFIAALLIFLVLLAVRRRFQLS